MESAEGGDRALLRCFLVLKGKIRQQAIDSISYKVSHRPPFSRSAFPKRFRLRLRELDLGADHTVIVVSVSYIM